MSSFSVREIARHPPAVILTPESTIKNAIKMMADQSVRHAIVMSSNNKMKGVISAKDILNYLGGGEKFRIVQTKFGGDISLALESPVSILIEKAPIIGRVDAPLIDLMSTMSKNNIGVLPLLDADENLWGLLSERHLFKLFEGNQMFVKVFEIMSEPIITLDAKSTIIDTIRLMIKNDIRRVLITGEDAVLGIVTVKDIIKFLGSKYVEDALARGLSDYIFKINISKIATPEPKNVSPDEDLSDAVKKMNVFNVGSLVVVRDGKPIGMITERDFLIKLPKLRGVEFIADAHKGRMLVGRVHF